MTHFLALAIKQQLFSSFFSQLSADLHQSLRTDGVMSVQEFVSWAVRHHKPPTPSASTPYRQLKRHHSLQVAAERKEFVVIFFFFFSFHFNFLTSFLQPFDEEGRRTAAPTLLTSTIGMCLFSTLDDGTGLTPAEEVIDAWLEEGIENGSEILEVWHSPWAKKITIHICFLRRWLFLMIFNLFNYAGFKL